MPSGDCPKGGNHNWVNIAETPTEVTHQCTKCQATSTRAKQNRIAGRIVNATALFFALSLFGLLAWMLIAAGQVQGS